MRKRKNKINLGIYSPPDDGVSYSEEGAQKESGTEETESSKTADDSTQETKRKNKKKASVNLGIY
jgi:hypothetical protein